MIEFIADRIKRFLSTEFLLTVALLAIFYKLAMEEKLTTEFVAAIGPVGAYIWGRTRQKADGR